MPKSLGQIHTCNFTRTLVDGSSTRDLLDLQLNLIDQLQKMIRQGQYYKIVGIDIGITPQNSAVAASGSVTGLLKYYAPTRGRCAAYRSAFKAVSEAMKTQGIKMRDNAHYDFRVPLNDMSVYDTPATFFNQATLDGINGLHLAGSAPNGLFGVHNANVSPKDSSAGFSSGYGTFGSNTSFLLNESNLGYLGNDEVASDDMQEIPFQLQWGQDQSQGKQSTVTFQWRPDPALFLAVMCGQIELQVVETNVESSPAGAAIDLEIAVMVSGWKSIMGNPDRKKKMLSKNAQSRKK